MVAQNHIRNPLEWSWDQLTGAKATLGSAAHSIPGAKQAKQSARPWVRRISLGDLREVLFKGLEDFGAYRTDVIFLCVIYPVAGLVMARLALGYDLLSLIFPLAAGFTLVGPVAALGLYEMSRRHEQGAVVTWADGFGVLRSPALGAILTLGLVLLAIFLLWMAAAYALYQVTLGPQPPASIAAFARALFTTGPGWVLIVVGIGIGFLFACLVLTISVVSFPMLLDQDVGLATAVATSVRAVWTNPGPMAGWGLIVAGGLVAGSLPLLLGLAIVMPVLGHATWHLYRKMVV